MLIDLGTIQKQKIGKKYSFGGATTTVGNDLVHTFTSSSTFQIFKTVSVQVLLVAGGGGGYKYGGGGGGGGLILNTYTFDPGVYTVTIGSGGSGGPYFQLATTSGNNSSIVGPNINLVAIGGGKTGSNGGSGGANGSGLQPSSASGGFGNNGGTGVSGAAAGGGGAGSTARPVIADTPDTTARIGGQGGIGIASDISGTLDYYAGGGGGQASHYAYGFNGPYYGWAPSSPLPNYYSSTYYDMSWINGHGITDRYDPQPFTVTINLSYTGDYTVKWYPRYINNFYWGIDGNYYNNSSATSTVKSVKYKTVNLSAGSHTLTIGFDSVDQLTRPTYYRGHIAFGIYDTSGNQIWNSRDRAILTGGTNRYGGGGGPDNGANNGQTGGSGIAIIRYTQ